MSDLIRGGVVACLFVVICCDTLLSWNARADAIKAREDCAADVKALSAKVAETLDEKVKLSKKIGHLEYLNRKFARLEREAADRKGRVTTP